MILTVTQSRTVKLWVQCTEDSKILAVFAYGENGQPFWSSLRDRRMKTKNASQEQQQNKSLTLMDVYEPEDEPNTPLTAPVEDTDDLVDRPDSVLRHQGTETRGRELICYWRQFKGKEKEFKIDIVASVPGSYPAPASRAHLYHADEHKVWREGVALNITPKTMNFCVNFPNSKFLFDIMIALLERRQNTWPHEQFGLDDTSQVVPELRSIHSSVETSLETKKDSKRG